MRSRSTPAPSAVEPDRASAAEPSVAAKVLRFGTRAGPLEEVAIAIEVCGPAPPNNDDCANAVPIFFGTTEFSSIDATDDGPELPGECDEGFGTGFGSDIWFTLTPDQSDGVLISTCDAADFDTRLALYTECDGALIACNDDGADCTGYTSRLGFAGVEGETYLLRVGGYNGASGSGTLSIEYGDVPPEYPIEVIAEWKVEDGGNGHFYAVKWLGQGSSFATADAEAILLGGYLATLTSPEETAFAMDFVGVGAPAVYARCAFGLVQSDKVIAMHDGCFCCTLSSALGDQIVELASKNMFNYMLIEASGVSEPSQIAPLFDLCDDQHNHDEVHKDGPQLGEVARLDTCVTVIDAAEFYNNLETMNEFADGELKSLTSEVIPSATQFFKRAYKISHFPGL